MVVYEPPPEGAADRRGNLRERGPLFGARPRAEGQRSVATKAQSLRWLENLREAQRLTAREEKRKEEILDVFRELRTISATRFDPRDFPPSRYSW
jgi:hypothetical protein